MRKFFSFLILLLFLVIISLIIILSTIGIKTDNFNNIISKKINQFNRNISLELNTIQFRLDIKDISLFLETKEPKINYRNTKIPAKNLRVYIDFISLIKSDPKIKKINISVKQLDIKQLKKISTIFKPSNFTSFINNKIKLGKLNTEISIYFDNNNLLDNFIAKGYVSDLKANIIDNVNFESTNFKFFADKSDILIKNFFSDAGPLNIRDGDIKIKLSPEIILETNFKTKLRYNNKLINYKNLINDFKYAKNIINLEANLDNSFIINFDKTYKVKKYDYKSKGNISKAILNFKKPLESKYFNEKINSLSIINSEIKTSFSSKKITTNISGKYSLNKTNLLLFNLENIIDKDLLHIKLNADYKNLLDIDLINYKKKSGKVANIFLNFKKLKDVTEIKKLHFTEENNSILIQDLKLNKNTFSSFKKIAVNTSKDGIKNNDFSILYGKKIIINGTQFDASNLARSLNKKKKKNDLLQINKDIEIDFKNIKVPFSENLKNFKLIGRIEKGKFTKISSKGDFGENNYLDITMKKDNNNKKKYLEIYSDLTRPLLTEYSFFKGLTGGKLLYSATINEDIVNSKLKIENFNVINAPGVIKLLSLADLGGLADLAEGDGLSFDFLEINMEKNKDFLKLNEILAIGPSISVLMEGYQNPTVTSLRGTLVPAKTLNKMLSKIPVIGSIIIPKEVGEGLFGISFKMKGPQGKMKTTINPIRTITPRFIQKIIDRNKNLK